MAFLLPHSVFIHAPKTGGQWVVKALEKSGLIVGKLGVVHTSPAEVAHEPAFQQRMFAFAMVRHPLSWYQSMWTHRVDENWIPINAPEWFTPRWIEIWAEFTKYCRADRFDAFIDQCTSHFPDGYVSMLYDAYTEGCGYVGKQERLVESLFTALKLSGEPFQEKQIRSTPFRNVRARRPGSLLQCLYTKDLVDLVMKTEAWAIEKFDYEDIPEGITPESIHARGAHRKPAQWHLQYAGAHDLLIRKGDNGIAVGMSKSLGRPVLLDGPSQGMLAKFTDPATPARALKVMKSQGQIDAMNFEMTFGALESQGFIHRVTGVLDRPVIILSCPRAGSTLLYETLRQAQDFWNIGGESHAVIESIPVLRPDNRGYESHCLGACDADRKTVHKLRAAFISYLQDRDGRRYLDYPPEQRPQKVRLLEKTPRNTLRVPFLNTVFPDALFVFLYREPRENINSIMEAWRAPGFWQFKGDLPGWDRDEWCMLLPPGWREMRGRPLEEIAALQWRVSNEQALDNLAELPSQRWIAIDFADFLAEPAAQIQKLCVFAGVAYDERLAASLETSLAPSSSTVTPPAPDKWKYHAEALWRVLPSVEAVAQRLRMLNVLDD